MDSFFELISFNLTQNVYNNFVEIHKEQNLIEITPQDWIGTTVQDALDYLGIKDKGIKIKSPIDEIIIYKSHIFISHFPNY